MSEKKFIKNIRTAKIIQLCVLLLLEVFFFIILFCNPTLSKELYSNKVLFTLCTCTWLLMIFSLLWLLYDFFKLKAFVEESHALNKAAYLDSLTGITNRHGLDTIFQTYDSPESLATLGCFMATITNLKENNDTLGRQAGDTMLQAFSTIFENIGDTFGIAGRNGGNNFILIINHCSDDTIKQFIQALNARITEYNTVPNNIPIHIQYAYALNTEENLSTFSQLLTVTYNKLNS